MSDSANYMQGKTEDFETLLQSIAPHPVDIDGDTCHHIHKSMRNFCSYFQCDVKGLCDDLFQDTRFSPDIKSYLEQLCRIIGTHYFAPLERIAHRRLSIYDVNKRTLSMIGPLTLLYSACKKSNRLDIKT